jgi:hypothetical protein
MSTSQATAEVFVTAFKSLNRRERDAVLERMLADEELREDLADTLALEARRHEPLSSFRQVLKDLKIDVSKSRCHNPGRSKLLILRAKICRVGRRTCKVALRERF